MRHCWRCWQRKGADAPWEPLHWASWVVYEKDICVIIWAGGSTFAGLGPGLLMGAEFVVGPPASSGPLGRLPVAGVVCASVRRDTSSAAVAIMVVAVWWLWPLVVPVPAGVRLLGLSGVAVLVGTAGLLAWQCGLAGAVAAARPLMVSASAYSCLWQSGYFAAGSGRGLMRGRRT